MSTHDAQVVQNLLEAETKAWSLFSAIEARQIICAGKTELEVNEEIFALANTLFGIEKYWHKRIVRSGKNTLCPYHENPPNLTLQEDDILFLDFGPIFEDWEADIGKTYVLGTNPDKLRLKNDIETAWQEVKQWFLQQPVVTGASLYHYATQLAQQYGWEYGGEIAGHLIGHFPHERLEPNNYGLYIHPENHNNLREVDAQGNPRHWILEIHFVDKSLEIGGFFEQLMV